MKQSEIISFLQKHPLFTCVSQPILNEYFNEKTISLHQFTAGTIICSPTVKAIGVGVLLCGQAQVTSGSNQESALLKTVFPGEIFGIANLYTESSFPSIITTQSDCTVLKIKSDAFCAYVEKEPSARRAYLAFLSKKIVYLNHKISVFTAGSAEKRLAFFLLENAKDGIWEAPYSMGTLAEVLGIGRASLYRALDGLLQMKLIIREDKKISIVNSNALNHFLNLTPSF